MSNSSVSIVAEDDESYEDTWEKLFSINYYRSKTDKRLAQILTKTMKHNYQVASLI